MSRSPSPIDVGDLDVDRPRQLLQHVAREPPAAVILHPPRLAIVVAELRDREIEIAVAIEIAGAHVRHARDLVDEHAVRETPAPVVLEHDHRADLRVVRERARRGWPRAISRSPSRSRSTALDVRRARRPRPSVRSVNVPPATAESRPRGSAAASAGEDVEQAVAIEIGDRRHGRRAAARQARPAAPMARRATGSRCAVARGDAAGLGEVGCAAARQIDDGDGRPTAT